jgi:hypothetical protein
LQAFCLVIFDTGRNFQSAALSITHLQLKEKPSISCKVSSNSPVFIQIYTLILSSTASPYIPNITLVSIKTSKTCFQIIGNSCQGVSQKPPPTAVLPIHIHMISVPEPWISLEDYGPHQSLLRLIYLTITLDDSGRISHCNLSLPFFKYPQTGKREQTYLEAFNIERS